MALIKRGDKYSVRYTIPKHFRDALDGRTQVWKTTGTGCLSEAKRREPRILVAIIDQVDADYRAVMESDDSPRSPANLFKITEELLSNVASGKMTSEQASDVLHDHREAFLKANSKSPSPAHTVTAQSAAALLGSRGRELPLSIAMEKHLNDLERRGRNHSTVSRKRMVLTRFMKFTGDPSVSAVDRRMAGSWVEDDINASDLKPKTKEWYISALQAAWTYFVLKGLTDINPFEKMVLLTKESSKGEEVNNPPRAWTQDEINNLKDVDKIDPLYSVNVIRLHSGVRVEEACCLRVRDIDLEANTMRIGGTTKNQQSQRVLPLHPALQKMMPNLIDKATPEGFLFDLKPGGLDNKRSHNLSKRIGRWIRKNVTVDKGVTGYTLRHTYAQAMRDLGVDRETIEFTTGHKDQSMLFGTYATQVGVDRLREAVEKLDFGFGS